ncbi:MAG: hypothetical protein J3Q66DRAFT_365612 [Benniella sp.]|nr:MAG: hypothetical protein J3Q66DRAFT_365612 [Benniella sp.]
MEALWDESRAERTSGLTSLRPEHQPHLSSASSRNNFTNIKRQRALEALDAGLLNEAKKSLEVSPASSVVRSTMKPTNPPSSDPKPSGSIGPHASLSSNSAAQAEDHAPKFYVGWPLSFQERHQFKQVKSHGESGSADFVAIELAMPDLRNNYPDQISETKKDKTRMSIAFAINATGTDKLLM